MDRTKRFEGKVAFITGAQCLTDNEKQLKKDSYDQ